MIPRVIVEGSEVTFEYAVLQVHAAGWMLEAGFSGPYRPGSVAGTGLIDTATAAEAALLAALAGQGMPAGQRATRSGRQADEAAGTWAGFNVPRSLVFRRAEGEALRQAGRREEMAERLEGALDAAVACQFGTVAVRVGRSMRQARMRVPGRDRAARALAIGLTRRERELVGLAGDGLTNIEIARRMGLGRPTVARIPSNAVTKLGADSRAHAAILVDALVE